MLDELRVTDLGVIAEAGLRFGRRMTALTGETGAGKTMLLDALALVAGGRADPAAVRPGSAEAGVEARFVDDALPDGELVARRVVPADGRSRAYLNGTLVTAGELSRAVAPLLELHGQGEQLALASTAAQRDALDAWAGVDTDELRRAREAVAELERMQESLGGTARARIRELELIGYQIDELESLGIEDPDEEHRLDAEESLLAGAAEYRAAARATLEVLDGDGGLGDHLSDALSHLGNSSPFADTVGRLMAVQADMEDISAELRRTAETIEEDPERLDSVRERRRALRTACRKYGDSLADVRAFLDDLRRQRSELMDAEGRSERLDADLAAARRTRDDIALDVGAARRDAAPKLASALARRLHNLAMPHAEFVVDVGESDAGDHVEFRLAPHPGGSPAPLAKAASGGELSRVLLALRLELSGGPETIVFDEVDAGIGGATALVVAEAMAQVADDAQVLVVTHLAQVAAYADQQVRLEKCTDGGSTTTTAATVTGEARIDELSRMLSGTPDSAAARSNAAELLQRAGGSRTPAAAT